MNALYTRPTDRHLFHRALISTLPKRIAGGRMTRLGPQLGFNKRDLLFLSKIDRVGIHRLEARCPVLASLPM